MKQNLKLKSGKEIIQAIQEERNRLQEVAEKISLSINELEAQDCEVQEQIERLDVAMDYLKDCF